MIKKAAVLGAGSWGTALSIALGERGLDVTLFGNEAEIAEEINTRHRNEKYLPGVSLPENVSATLDIAQLIDCPLILLVVPSKVARLVLGQLRDAGLGSLPGGGAEIFDDRVHDEAYKNKVGEAGWFEVHRAAHSIGMYSNATMLYGHIETPAERIKHLIKLREHQDESIANRPARFNAIIPLPFIPDNS